MMDILGIDLPEDAPVLIHIHGGYWQLESISHANQTFIGTKLRENDIKTIVLGYELCPKLTISEIVKNIEKAVTKCLDYAKKQKSRAVYISGHSSGAHLVACLFTDFVKSLPEEDQKLIKAVFLSCGLYDLTPLCDTLINTALKLDTDIAKQASPQFKELCCHEDTEFHVITAEYDSPSFIEQGRNFHEKLLDCGIKAEYHMLEELDHFEAVEKIVDNDSEVAKLVLDSIKKTL